MKSSNKMTNYYDIDLSDDGQKACLVQPAALQRDLIAQRLKTAWVNRVSMNNTDINLLQTLFPNRAVVHVPTMFHSHPILHALNNYAYEDMERRIASFPADYITLEIGGRVDSVCHHNDHYINTPRDFSRFAHQWKNESLARHCISGAATHECTRGAQNCRHPADVAFAINSLYDCTHDDIVQIFEAHNLRCMFAWMYFPHTLIAHSLAEVDNSSGYYKVKYTANNKLAFYHGEGNTVYEHDTTNWNRLFTTTIIRTNAYDIEIESIEQVGIFHCLKFTRVAQGVLAIPKKPVLTAFDYEQYYFVPNFADYIRSGKSKIVGTLATFIVPKAVVDKAVNYGSRQIDMSANNQVKTETLNYPSFHAALASMISQVQIGQTIIWSGWKVSGLVLPDVTLSLFILVSMIREDRMKILSDYFRFAQSKRSDNFIWKQIREIKNHILRPLHAMIYDDTDYQSEEEFNSTVINSRHFRPVSDQIIGQIYRCIIPTTVWNPPYTAPRPVVIPSAPPVPPAPELLIDFDLNDNTLVNVDQLPPDSGRTDLCLAGACTCNLIACTERRAKHKASYEALFESIYVSTPFKNGPAASDEKFLMPAPFDNDRFSTTRQAGRICVTHDAVYHRESLKLGHETIRISTESFILGGVPEFCQFKGLWRDERHFASPDKYPRHKNRDITWTAATNLKYKPNTCLIQAIAESMKVSYTRAWLVLYVYTWYRPFPTNIVAKGEAFLQLRDQYFFAGNYQTEFFDYVMLVACEIFDLTITIVNDDNKSRIIVGSGQHQVQLHYGNQHYSFIPAGGGFKSSHKWDVIYRRAGVRAGQSFLDISAAPGDATLVARQYSCAVTTWVYEGVHALPPTLLDEAKIKYTKYKQLSDMYDHTTKYDVLLNDVSTDKDADQLIDITTVHALGWLSIGGTLILKSFGCSVVEDQLKHLFSKVDTIKAEDYRHELKNGQTDERFILCTGYNGKPAFYTVRKTIHIDVQTVRDYLSNDTIDIASKVRLQHNDSISSVSKTFIFLTGTAGCGKSSFYKDNLKNTHQLICPTNELATASNGRTEHRFILSHTNKPVVVDEGHAYHRGFFYFVPDESYILGDPNQIKCINDSESIFDQAAVPTYNNFTYRCPKDVTDILCDLLNTKIQCRSKKMKSITISGDKFSNDVAGFRICFNRDTAKAYNAVTVHSAMGTTQPTVALYVDRMAEYGKGGSPGIIEKTSYVYVAMTRNTDKLVIYGDKDMIEKYFLIGGTLIDEMGDPNKNVINDVYEETNVTPVENVPDVIIEKSAEQPPDICAIYDTAFKHVNPATEYVTMIEPPIPAVQVGVIKTNLDTISERPIRSTGRTITDRTRRTIWHIPSGKMTVGATAGRYTTKIGSKSPIQVDKEMARIMYKRLAEFIFGRSHMLGQSAAHKLDSVLANFNASNPNTPDELRKFCGDYIESMNKKVRNHNIPATESLKINDPLVVAEEVINFFMKKQSKLKAEDAFDTSEKCGQGISQYSKKMNIAGGCASRLIMEHLTGFLNCGGNDQYRPTHQIVIPVGTAEANISTLIASFLSANPIGKRKFFNCDVSQWDSKYCGYLIQFAALMFSKVGFNNIFIEEYTVFRYNWTMKYKGADNDAAMLHGIMRQHSGGFDTLNGNTFGNWALIATIFDFEGLLLSLWKGDDASVACNSYKPSTYYEMFTKVANHKFKGHDMAYGEFAGYFVTKEGLLPDLFRKTAKFLYKLYGDVEHFEEAKLSVAQDINCLTNDGYNVLPHVLSAYYTTNGCDPESCNPENMRRIISFAATIADMQYDNLHRFDGENFNLI